MILNCNPNIIHADIAKFTLGLETKGIGEELWIYASILLVFANVVVTLHSKNYIRMGSVHIKVNLILSLLFIFTILFLHFPNFALGDLHVDENEHIGEGLSLVRDLRYWKSVDGTTVGPLSIYPILILDYIKLGIGYFPVRLLNVWLWILTAFFVYKIFRLKFQSSEARVLLLPLIILIGVFCTVYYVSYNGEVPTTLLITIGIYFILKLINNPSSVFLQFLVGFFLVLIPFGKIQAAPIGLGLGISIMIYLISKRIHVLSLLSGTFIPLLLLLFYLVKYDVFNDFWQAYILNNISYASSGEGLHTQRGFIINLLKIPLLLLRNIETRLIFLFGLTLIFIVIRKIVKGSNYSIIHIIKTHPKEFHLVLLLFLSVVSIAIPGNIFPHYTIFLIIPLFICSGWFFKYAVSFFQNESMMSIWRLYLFIFCILPSVVTIFSYHSRIRFIDEKLISSINKRDLVSEICALADPEDRIAAWGTDNYIFPETGLAMGTREAHTQRQILSTNQQTYYLDRYLNDLKENKPKFFIDAVYTDHWLFKNGPYQFENFDNIRDYIESNYNFHSSINNVRLYVRKK